jgi:hypothetical protein
MLSVYVGPSGWHLFNFINHLTSDIITDKQDDR